MKINKEISTETTKDLINIHNFLTAIMVNDTENISVLTLTLMLHSELQEREDAKVYIDQIKKLLNT